MIENIDVHFLQGVFGAELVDLMMYFVRNPIFLILFSVVQHSLIHELFSQFIDHLHFVEVDQCAIRSAAGDVADDISAYAGLHLYELLVEGNSEMGAWLAESGLQHSEFLIDTHVAFLNLMIACEECEHVGSNHY